MLEAMKLNLASMVSLKAENKTVGDMIAACISLSLITIAPIIFFTILYKNREVLQEKENQE